MTYKQTGRQTEFPLVDSTPSVEGVEEKPLFSGSKFSHLLTVLELVSRI